MIRLGNKYSKVNHRFIFCCNLEIFCVVYFGDSFGSYNSSVLNAPSEAWLGIGPLRSDPLSNVSVFFNILLLFFGPGCVILCISFIDSVSSLFEFFGAVCLYISCVIIYGTRAISLSLHLRLSGERSHCVLVFPRVFVARGSEPMIRFLTMVSACISHCRDTLHSTFMEQILSNVQAVGDISK